MLKMLHPTSTVSCKAEGNNICTTHKKEAQKGCGDFSQRGDARKKASPRPYTSPYHGKARLYTKTIGVCLARSAYLASWVALHSSGFMSTALLRVLSRVSTLPLSLSSSSSKSCCFRSYRVGCDTRLSFERRLALA